MTLLLAARPAVLIAVALAGLAAVAPAAAQGPYTPRPFDLTGPKADRVFFVLGMLMEHPGGRAVRGADQVELFYCSEQDQVPLFVRVVTALANEQGLPAAVGQEMRQGCLTTVVSAAVAGGLAAFYPRPGASLELTAFARPGARVAGHELAAADLERRRALAYVAGSWARHRRDRSLLLPAGSRKADRLAMLLKALGCANVRVESRLDAVPGSNTVHFEPTPEVAEWLQRRW
jgi:hypothetical protein